jgi:hypothetical protein
LRHCNSRNNNSIRTQRSIASLQGHSDANNDDRSFSHHACERPGAWSRHKSGRLRHGAGETGGCGACAGCRAQSRAGIDAGIALGGSPRIIA